MDAAQGRERGQERAHRKCANGRQALAGEHKKHFDYEVLFFYAQTILEPEIASLGLNVNDRREQCGACAAWTRHKVVSAA